MNKAEPLLEMRRPRPAEVNYRPRILGPGFLAITALSLPGDELFPLRAGLAAAGAIVWPHVAYWSAMHKGGGHDSERRNVLIDAAICGLVAASVSLRLWPVALIGVMLFINALLFGGPKFLAVCLLPLVLSAVAALAAFGITPHFETEPAPTFLSLIGILGYVVLIGTIAYRQRQRARQARTALKEEEEKSQKLLANVFPQTVIPRLRANEAPIADQFADVTVIFADIVEFTPLAERLGPRRTVLLLNDLFGRFDQAAHRVQVEKIETTGDGYLAVAGAPTSLDHHAEAAADFALAMLDAVRRTDISGLAIRVGLHTGPIYAGVVGESRFHYKIFGETVNVASRIQGHSEPGRILISESCSKRLPAMYTVKEHGTVLLKGHGNMRTYWLLEPS